MPKPHIFQCVCIAQLLQRGSHLLDSKQDETVLGAMLSFGGATKPS